MLIRCCSPSIVGVSSGVVNSSLVSPSLSLFSLRLSSLVGAPFPFFVCGQSYEIDTRSSYYDCYTSMVSFRSLIASPCTVIALFIGSAFVHELVSWKYFSSLSDTASFGSNWYCCSSSVSHNHCCCRILILKFLVPIMTFLLIYTPYLSSFAFMKKIIDNTLSKGLCIFIIDIRWKQQKSVQWLRCVIGYITS